jgi:hypothetical protein
MKLPIKKIWLIVMAITIFLIIGNPKKSRFKEYLGYESSYKAANGELRRKYNFVLFSIYTQGVGYMHVYIGIGFNFFHTGVDY